MLTRSLPPKTFFSLSSARISLLFCGFCRLFLRMWSHTFETTSLRGSGELPVIAARSAEGCTGRAKPPPAFLPDPDDFDAIRPSCCSALDRAQSSAPSNAVFRGETTARSTVKWNDPVLNVMTDVRAASVRYARTLAPFLH